MNWWRGAAIYQVYPRSFADGNGDGIGDLAGLRQKLPYLAELGVDAVWLSPWYPSPLADGGYDVADYRDVEPVYGTLVEAEKLIGEAHELGIRVIIDIVPNHCSDQHPWFQEALRGKGRDRFWFHEGDAPPNDWQSRFGGPAWSQAPDGSWYLHLYSPQQPDFNWDHPEVRAEFEDVLRFWLDRGVDGFRIDVADGLVKDFSRPDADAPYSDQDGVHEIYRSWRRVLDAYPGERVFVGEMWLPDPVRFARYLRADELHSAFNFDFLCCPWEPAALRSCVDATLAAHAPVGAPPTWVLSNHDVTRHVTRYGRADTSFDFGDRQHLAPTDLELGTRRARAAALLTTALPGCVYVYQGEELGLEEVEDLPDELREDPVWERSGHTDPGRDGCRVPIPWGEDGPSWLPRPESWRERSVRAQSGDPDSMLSLYREVLRLRRAEPALGDGDMAWLDLGPEVLAFTREPGFACVVNLSAAPVALPEHRGVLLSSGPLADGALPPDTAAWIRYTR
ncbi:alpha-glucosidase [Saccharothrix coeruleofusca]|uniref:glycoside hydrolase family 13 protein n=1 Tax=Saccharothrix coeruleofusca TaxID=33919 RepID=UPI001AE3AB16|nr:glycoside hydrolase family 13 protein [Saccharothrix coeruleofusca]MBP2337907.1 alpha-glucosidase [Saccharothrix coeruleofusca]